MAAAVTNVFTSGPLGPIFLRTALPIILVMGMNGALAIIDAMFLGIYVGADALGAVTLMFPPYMFIVALATLVSSGMSSLLARHLGGGRFDEAEGVFAGAHGLAITISLLFIVLFLVFGRDIALLAAGGSKPLADMGYVYLAITALTSPLIFILSVNSDALRNEGRAGLMAVMSLVVTLLNIAFTYLLVAEAKLGVAGSAYGTVLAQVCGFAAIVTFRLRGKTVLRPAVLLRHRPTTAWRPMLALGAPMSLSFIGIALSAAAVIAALQLVQTDRYEATVSAYGILTRIMTFTFLPLLGMSLAMQSIIGNNYGAELWRRSDDSLRLGLLAALLYGVTVEVVLTSFPRTIAGAFVDDPQVIGELGRIMPIVVTMYVVSGPMAMVAAYFHAIGDAGRAAILRLSRPYAFGIPLTFLLPLVFGEVGIWIASPTAEFLVLLLTVAVLARTARRKSMRWGLFTAAAGDPSRHA